MNCINCLKPFSFGIRTLSEGEGWGPEHRGRRPSRRKGEDAQALGTGTGRAVGWEGSEHEAASVLRALSLRVAVFS